MSAHTFTAPKQNDLLLWVAGALVAAMGIIWLVIASPWSGGSDESAAVKALAGAAQPSPEEEAAAGTRLETSLDDNPLRMAELAYQAGMLVEPEDYSAWALYRRVLKKDPDNATAKQGLETIAAELLRRANAAVDQGRFDDARKAIERIRQAIPDYPDANELAFRLDELAPKRPERAAPEPSASVVEADAEPGPGAPENGSQGPTKGAEVDPAAQAHEAFAAAMTADRLLTPADESAKHFLDELTAVAPDDAETGLAARQLFDRFLARANESIAAADTEAASTWIDEAEALGVDSAAVAAERQELTKQLVEIESARRLPASELSVVSYSPPEYPTRALERGLGGWVDVEFTVARDGTTRDIEVTDASNERYFKDEAVKAVGEWRFEPRVFMNQTIEQRAYTRIRFNFEAPR